MSDTFSITELAKLERVLANGTKLLAVDLVIIELMRRRRGDSVIRELTGLTQSRLIRTVYELRQKLGCGLTECVRDAADRHEIPRLRPSDR